MEERLNELELRVAYLEQELEVGYEEEMFNHNVRRFFPDDASVEIRDGHYGYYAKVTDINGDDVQGALNRIEEHEKYDAAVTETAEGLGMEVWTEERLF